MQYLDITKHYGCHLYKDRSSMLAAAGTDMPKRKPLSDFTDYSIDLLGNLRSTV
ncbi:MAG: hypothetical protein HFE79_08050 [Ruminiclostridium sp.]|nr:hypothetical protein [Ruminiclostridium sp.]